MISLSPKEGRKASALRASSSHTLFSHRERVSGQGALSIVSQPLSAMPEFEKGKIVQFRKDIDIRYSGRRVTVLEVKETNHRTTYRFREINGYWPEDMLKEPEPTIIEKQYDE